MHNVFIRVGGLRKRGNHEKGNRIFLLSNQSHRHPIFIGSHTVCGHGLNLGKETTMDLRQKDKDHIRNVLRRQIEILLDLYETMGAFVGSDNSFGFAEYEENTIKDARAIIGRKEGNLTRIYDELDKK